MKLTVYGLIVIAIESKDTRQLLLGDVWLCLILHSPLESLLKRLEDIKFR